MSSRRHFLASTAASAAALAVARAQDGKRADRGARATGHDLPAREPSELPQNTGGGRFRPGQKIGMGGVQMGNGFSVTPDEQAYDTMEAAWNSGVRYFDTSPYYGVGVSERRFGNFLDGKDPDEYVISTKVGRVLKADADANPSGNWKGRLNFGYDYDYTADGVRRSIEDSLHRLGVPQIDIVFIHDLSPDNPDIGDEWEDYFEVARKGAMPELTKMREEGMIKAWGMGVNELEPTLRCLEVADPDITLQATQYSLVKHAEALHELLPKCEERGVSIVVGAPLMAGYLAGVERYLYSGEIPQWARDQLAGLQEVATRHAVDLRTAALLFTIAPDIVSATIPGPRNATQMRENVASLLDTVPSDFWAECKEEGLIEPDAPTPA